MRRFYTVMTAVALTVATVFSGVSTVQAGGYHEYDVEKYVMNQVICGKCARGQRIDRQRSKRNLQRYVRCGWQDTV